MNFYNENDRKSASWLRELIRAGEIPAGDVDERSIIEIKATELTEYVQCHFFAGIAGWSYALRLAGWPEDRPVWTGSCPCQPYSCAGQQKGEADSRNLWPAFFRLIKECRPDSIFGEQVASAISFGWLDGIQADLEAESYALGHCVLGAHSVGAPHKRQRLYWMADAGRASDECWMRHSETPRTIAKAKGEAWQLKRSWNDVGGSSSNGWVEHARPLLAAQRGTESIGGIASSRLGTCVVGDTKQPGLEGQSRTSRGIVRQVGQVQKQDRPTGKTGNALNAWNDYELAPCRDGKSRRIESGLQPLAHGIPGRVGLLRGYGNAIIAPLAAEFIQASGLIGCRF